MFGSTLFDDEDSQLLLPLTLCLASLLAAWWVLRNQFTSIPNISVRPPQVGIENETSISEAKIVPCYNPATKELLGHMPAMDTEEVKAKIRSAQKAAEVWKTSNFDQRRLLLRILLKYITENQHEICRVASLDSGKVILDAAFGEVTVTCEKICWLLKEGERWLRPEYRSSSRMMFYKSARVEYHPLGVIGAIVPWNYPFHNLFNPLVSTLFAGNALVIKVSEHASWSAKFYGSIIQAALAAAGAPTDLVQIITGYAEAGSALVQGGVQKVIFVGSTGVGKKVMAAAAETLTPVVLELGGKDPIIICDDADIDHACAIALRGTYISNGQNCAGCERVLIHQSIYQQCLDKLVAGAKSLRQGAPLEGDPTAVDAGALALPGLLQNIDSLVQDAVSQGAQALVGGMITHPKGARGDFFAPTLLTGVRPSMRIWKEEVFGPVMVVVPFSDDAEAVALANDCPFGLGSNILSRNSRKANIIASQLQAGMTTINDFATSYMNQSLPFGGVKESGFDKFAGVEGLRGVCLAKSVCEDRWPFLLRTDIPPLLQYPTKPAAFAFQTSLVRMFYAPTLTSKLTGLLTLLKALLQRPDSI